MSTDPRERDALETHQSRSAVAVVTRMLTHLVSEALGIRALRPSTLVAGVLTVFVGIPLVATAFQALLEAAVKTWFATGSPLLVSAATAVLALLVALAFWGWAAVSVRQDLRLQDHDPELRGGPGHADVRAMLFSCSRPPDPAWLRQLVDASPDEREALAGDHDRARWVQLLVRSLQHHGRFLERLVLVVNDYDEPVRSALQELVVSVLRDHPGRDAQPLQRVEFLDAPDPDDADDVRSRASGKLYQLRDVMDHGQRIGVTITAGTTAMSVGLVLAASLHSVDVLYHLQTRDVGGSPFRIDTDRARRRLLEMTRSMAG